jgi:hypothetical protein
LHARSERRQRWGVARSDLQRSCQVMKRVSYSSAGGPWISASVRPRRV